MTSYNKFAEYYDTLTLNIDYKGHAEYYDKIVDRFDGKKGILLDLACGTGSLSEEMAKLGYDVIGVDLSEEMLSKALDKKFASGLPIQYLCQDMCELDMYGTIDVNICSLDSLNHLDSIESVRKAIQRVSLFCEPNGLFIFDMNTQYKHEKILADNTYVYDTDKVYCVWENELQDNYKVDISLTFFEKNNDCYKRYDEFFSENAYPTESIDEILVKAGFDILAHYDYFTDEPVKANSERITYVARKVR